VLDIATTLGQLEQETQGEVWWTHSNLAGRRE
jgi:hypothetical protein